MLAGSRRRWTASANNPWRRSLVRLGLQGRRAKLEFVSGLARRTGPATVRLAQTLRATDAPPAASREAGVDLSRWPEFWAGIFGSDPGPEPWTRILDPNPGPEFRTSGLGARRGAKFGPVRCVPRPSCRLESARGPARPAGQTLAGSLIGRTSSGQTPIRQRQAVHQLPVDGRQREHASRAVFIQGRVTHAGTVYTRGRYCDVGHSVITGGIVTGVNRRVSAWPNWRRARRQP